MWKEKWMGKVRGSFEVSFRWVGDNGDSVTLLRVRIGEGSGHMLPLPSILPS